MKTKELIELLQKEDPSGESFVKVSGGAISNIIKMPGYYDGRYRYLSNGKYVTSSKNDKIVLFTKEPEDFIWEDLDRDLSKYKMECVENHWSYSFDKEYWFNKLKEYFVFETEYDKRESDSIFENLQKEYDDWVDYIDENSKKELEEIISQIKEGHKFYQLKNFKSIYYDWIVIDPHGNINNSMSMSMTSPILESGLFVKIDHDDKYWEWILDE